jgi:hypothetical protein
MPRICVSPCRPTIMHHMHGPKLHMHAAEREGTEEVSDPSAHLSHMLSSNWDSVASPACLLHVAGAVIFNGR